MLNPMLFDNNLKCIIPKIKAENCLRKEIDSNVCARLVKEYQSCWEFHNLITKKKKRASFDLEIGAILLFYLLTV